MINKDHCLLFGTIIKPHGTKGSCIVATRFPVNRDEIKGNSVFLEIEGLLVPFFIENILERTVDSLVLKLEDLDSEEKVREITGVDVYIMKDKIRQSKNAENDFVVLKNYKVIDVQKGYIGVAGEMEDIALNPLLHVKSDKGAFLIPFQKEIIFHIDHKKREVKIKAPEGLFNL